MYTITSRSLAKSLISSSSFTEGAPGFSRKMIEAPLLTHWRKSFGLSGVLPAMRHKVGFSNFSRSSTLDTAMTPLDSRDATSWANAGGTFGQSSSLRKNGSTIARTLTFFISRSWVRWYHPMPFLGIPHPTKTTSRVPAVSGRLPFFGLGGSMTNSLVLGATLVGAFPESGFVNVSVTLTMTMVKMVYNTGKNILWSNANPNTTIECGELALCIASGSFCGMISSVFFFFLPMAALTRRMHWMKTSRNVDTDRGRRPWPTCCRPMLVPFGYVA